MKTKRKHTAAACRSTSACISKSLLRCNVPVRLQKLLSICEQCVYLYVPSSCRHFQLLSLHFDLSYLSLHILNLRHCVTAVGTTTTVIAIVTSIANNVGGSYWVSGWALWWLCGWWCLLFGCCCCCNSCGCSFFLFFMLSFLCKWNSSCITCKSNCVPNETKQRRNEAKPNLFFEILSFFLQFLLL